MVVIVMDSPVKPANDEGTNSNLLWSIAEA
jgi:hypothetical protein